MRRETSMRTKETIPRCSFCLNSTRTELVRAGGRDFWICSACVQQPVVEDLVEGSSVCTFCQRRITSRWATFRGKPRSPAVARRGHLLCSGCLTVCADIIAEDRAFAASRRNRSRGSS